MRNVQVYTNDVRNETYSTLFISNHIIKELWTYMIPFILLAVVRDMMTLYFDSVETRNDKVTNQIYSKKLLQEVRICLGSLRVLGYTNFSRVNKLSDGSKANNIFFVRYRFKIQTTSCLVLRIYKFNYRVEF